MLKKVLFRTNKFVLKDNLQQRRKLSLYPTHALDLVTVIIKRNEVVVRLRCPTRVVVTVAQLTDANVTRSAAYGTYLRLTIVSGYSQKRRRETRFERETGERYASRGLRDASVS